MAKKPTTATAILIDPFACETKIISIAPDDLESYYAALSHESMPVRTFEVVRHPKLTGRDALFVDEEGLFKNATRGFVIRGGKPFALFGKGLIIGAKANGDTADHATPMADILPLVVYLQQSAEGRMVQTIAPWERPAA